jgi:hypothetical protein
MKLFGRHDKQAHRPRRRLAVVIAVAVAVAVAASAWLVFNAVIRVVTLD